MSCDPFVANERYAVRRGMVLRLSQFLYHLPHYGGGGCDWYMPLLLRKPKHYTVYLETGYCYAGSSNSVTLTVETARNVSGGTTTHHQELRQLYLQHLVFVTLLLLPAKQVAVTVLQ